MFFLYASPAMDLLLQSFVQSYLPYSKTDLNQRDYIMVNTMCVALVLLLSVATFANSKNNLEEGLWTIK